MPNHSSQTTTDSYQPRVDGIDVDAITTYAGVAFRDLLDLERHNPKIFDELYYNRENEFTLFKNIMSDAPATGVNVVVKGQAGTGKSNFIYKLIRDRDTLIDLNLHPIMIDYRVAVPSNSEGCLITFLQKIRDYFSNIGQPIHTLKDLTNENTPYNVRVCYDHLEKLSDDNRPHLLILLDDFDYAEDEWYTLLDYFLGFAASKKASVVFTVRPLLLATVEAYDDRFNHYYNRDCQLIDLKPLDVARVLATRIALLLTARDKLSLYGRICERIRLSSDAFQSALKTLGLRKLGYSSLESLPRFEYPFTDRHNMFMRRITNGNLREIFDIATDSLIYMFDEDNKNFVEVREEDGCSHISIGREGDMRLFMDGYTNKKGNFEIIDLHKHRSRAGNSLWYNVLEMVKLRSVVDDTFYGILRDLGHKKTDVDHAISFLSDKSQRLISPLRLRQRSSATLAYDVPEYSMTDKGDYYMQICKWDEYITRCKTPGKSVTEV